MDLSQISEDRLRTIFKAFNRFMILLWRLGLGAYGNGTRWGGSYMVIKQRGRRTGLARLTPVNYALIEGEVYCTAGFGRRSDWYQNLRADPNVEVWLPNGRWAGVAQDVNQAEDRVRILRRVIIASGFAGPMLGVNPQKLTDEDVEALLHSYRLVRIHRTAPITGPGGPGDLIWVWPLVTMALSLMLLLRPRKSRS